MKNGDRKKYFEIQLWNTLYKKGYYNELKRPFLLYEITNKDTFDNRVRQFLGTDEKYIMVLLGDKLDLANENSDNKRRFYKI